VVRVDRDRRRQHLLDSERPAWGVRALQARIDPGDIRRRKGRSVLGVQAGRPLDQSRGVLKLVRSAAAVIIVLAGGGAEGINRRELRSLWPDGIDDQVDRR